jgi:hypothetical protein
MVLGVSGARGGWKLGVPECSGPPAASLRQLRRWLPRDGQRTNTVRARASKCGSLEDWFECKFEAVVA